MIAEAEQAGTLIERSLAEATVVVDRLSGQATELAESIAEGSREAFYVPFEHASLVLGAIMLVASVGLLWLTPRRVVEVPPTVMASTPGSSISVISTLTATSSSP